MLYRALTAGDQATVWQALYHALFVPIGAEPFDPGIVNEPSIARYAKEWMQRAGDRGFVAKVGGAAIGAAWVRRWTNPEEGFGFVEESIPELSIAVWPGHRGKGVGTRLLSMLLDEVSKEDAAVSLSVSRANPALYLYQRFGFVAAKAIRDDSLTMLKRFADTSA